MGRRRQGLVARAEPLNYLSRRQRRSSRRRSNRSARARRQVSGRPASRLTKAARSVGQSERGRRGLGQAPRLMCTTRGGRCCCCCRRSLGGRERVNARKQTKSAAPAEAERRARQSAIICTGGSIRRPSARLPKGSLSRRRRRRPGSNCGLPPVKHLPPRARARSGVFGFRWRCGRFK